MESVEFIADVGSDRLIHLPSGIDLPEGPVRVIICPQAINGPQADKLKPTREWLLSLAREAERDPTDLPSDMAEQHDHYAHGKPKS